MKIKINIQRLSLTLLAAIFVLVGAMNVVQAIYGPAAQAVTNAPAAGAPIVARDNTILCSATISGPVDGSNPYNSFKAPRPDGGEMAALANGGIPNVPTAAKAVFSAIESGSQNVLAVSFKGAGGATSSDTLCTRAMVLFRLSSVADKTTFYGLWLSPPGNSQPIPDQVVSGSVDAATGTITIGVPSGFTAYITLNDPSKLLANPQYFDNGSGGGGGGGSSMTLATCLATYSSNPTAAQKNCLDSKGAGFLDIAHINFDGQIYTAGQWGGGDTITYSLDPSTTDSALAALAPSFSVNTQQGSNTDIGIQSDKPSIDEIKNNLQRVLGLKQTINIDYFIGVGGAPQKLGTVSTSSGSINTVANYYPNSKDPTADVIALAFTNGAGGNESPFYGTYSKTRATTFTLAGGGFSDCGTLMQPRFELATVPTAAQETAGGIVNAIWYIQADADSSISGSALGCHETGIPVVIRLLKPDSTAPGGATTTSAAPTPEAKCDATLLNPLTWIICPLASAASDAVNKLDNEINCLLQVDLSDVFGAGTNTNNPYASICGTASSKATSDKTSSAYYKAWNTFRLMALALIVIAGLVMVISQAAGFEILDAYTIRKVLPRLLIAGVAITLSWQLMQLLVALTNAVGFGVREIIYAPFSGFSSLQLNQLGSQFALALIGGAAFLVYGPLGIASFALTALLGVLVAFVTLVLRKMVIIFLLMLAPFAIACYILPNTQRFWKIWWETLSKALLMFPIIAAFIAVGRVFSATIWNGSNTSTINTLIAFIAYFAPYFMIPLAFRLAGGAVSTLAGLANDRSRGVFDGLKNFRGNQSKQRRHNAGERIKSGNALRGEGSASRGISRALENASLIGAGGMTLSAQKRRSRMRTARATRQHDLASKGMQENEQLRSFSADDDKLLAGIHGEDEAGVRRVLQARDVASVARGGTARFSDPTVLNDTVAEIMSAKRSMGREVFNKAATRALSPTGTAFTDAGEMLQTINAAYGSDRSGAGKALAEMRDAAIKSGRVDLGGASYGTLATQMTQMSNGTQTAAGATAEVMQSVRRSSGGSTAAYGKPQSARAVAKAHADHIFSLLGSASTGVAMTQDDGTLRVANDRDIKQALASAHGVHDALRAASPDNAREFADGLMSREIDTSTLSPLAKAALGPAVLRGGTGQSSTGPTGPLTIRQVMDDLAGQDQQYLEIRTDFATSASGAIDQERQRQLAQTVGVQPQPGQQPGQRP